LYCGQCAVDERGVGESSAGLEDGVDAAEGIAHLAIDTVDLSIAFSFTLSEVIR
jgi:hypothetical protein